MPPADSQRLQVLEAIQTKLRQMNGGASYHNTVKSASVVLDPAVNILTLPTTELPFFIIEPTTEGSKFYMPAMRLRHQFQVVVTGRQDIPTGTGTSRKTQTWEKLIADIEFAVTHTGTTDDVTLGGKCVDVRLLEPTPGFDLGGSPTIVVVQPMVVHLVRSYGTP